MAMSHVPSTTKNNPPPKNEKMEKIQNVKNKNRQKHVFFVNLRLWEHKKRIQHVHKPLHAKYELRSCLERRVMTILRQKNSKKRI